METLEAHTISTQPDVRQAEVASALAGSIAIKEREATDKDITNIPDYNPYQTQPMATDAPSSLVNRRGENNASLTIRPSEIDKIGHTDEPKITLPDGSKIFYYDFFTHQVKDSFIGDVKRDSEDRPVLNATPTDRLIIVSTPDGSTRYTMTRNRYNTLQDPDLDILEDPAGQKFLERLGYIFVNGQAYAPSPETFKAFCAKQGIEVEIFPDRSKLKAPEYLEAFAQGRYPVGALDSYYSHDIQDDHITALLIGGPDLQNAIKEALQLSLADPSTEVDDLTLSIDSFTNAFRSVVLPYGTLGEAYGKESGRRTLKKEAGRVGIAPDKIDQLVAIAQQRARQFGLTPKDLD